MDFGIDLGTWRAMGCLFPRWSCGGFENPVPPILYTLHSPKFPLPEIWIDINNIIF